MTNIQFIAKSVPTAAINIQNTVKLLEEDCTIPFIPDTGKKDTTGNLDEKLDWTNCKTSSKEYEAIGNVRRCLKNYWRTKSPLRQNWKQKIEQSFDLQEIEDFYQPFFKKEENQSR